MLDLARRTAEALTALVSKGTTPVLLVDEAQELSPAVLTALRFLTQAEMDSVSPLALILVGHPALRQRLKLNTYEAFAQRVGLRFHLTGLTAAETAEYIRHHLRVAGREQPLFTDTAVDLLFHHSRPESAGAPAGPGAAARPAPALGNGDGGRRAGGRVHGQAYPGDRRSGGGAGGDAAAAECSGPGGDAAAPDYAASPAGGCATVPCCCPGVAGRGTGATSERGDAAAPARKQANHGGPELADS